MCREIGKMPGLEQKTVESELEAVRVLVERHFNPDILVTLIALALAAINRRGGTGMVSISTTSDQSTTR